MNKILLSIIVSFCTLTINAQNSVYQISLKKQSTKKALEFYQNKISEIIQLNLEKSNHLKQEIYNRFTNNKKDSLHTIVTYWLQNNGKIHPFLFGATFKRNTPAFNELKNIVSNIQIPQSDIYKLNPAPQGRQIFVTMNFKKDPLKNKIVLFKYDKKKQVDKKDADSVSQRPPFLKGCGKVKKYDYTLELKNA